jgi:uncharacterized protein YdeI (BOF family)
MERYLLIAMLVFGVSTITLAQEKEGKEGKIANPPDVAKAAFDKAFPGSKNVKWEKEGSEFEVSFSNNGKIMSAVLDGKGILKESEVELKASELPADILQYIKDHYKGAKIKEAAKITYANGEVNYEAEVNKIDVMFDKDGKFLKEVKD